MPLRDRFSDRELMSMLSAPEEREACVRYYTFSPAEREWIDSCRGDFNRLGFAVQLAYMKYPGIILEPEGQPSPELLDFVAEQVAVPTQRFSDYAKRPQTRREHIARLQELLGMRTFSSQLDGDQMLGYLQGLAFQGMRPMPLAEAMIAQLRERKVLLPALGTIKKQCAEALTLGDRQLYAALLANVTAEQLDTLEGLLRKPKKWATTGLTWLRRHKEQPCTRNLLNLIEKLNFLNELKLPEGNLQHVSRNRLKRLARMAETRRPQSLEGLEVQHRQASLVALGFEMHRKLKDLIMEMFLSIISIEVRNANKRSQKEFLEARKAVVENLTVFADTGEALDRAKKKGGNGFKAITDLMTWKEFMEHVAQARLLSQKPEVEAIRHIIDAYHRIHRFVGPFLESMPLRAHPTAQPTYDALQAIKQVHAEGRVDLKTLPKEFIKPIWRNVVFGEDGINYRYYEICAMVALKEAATRGDIWVDGSRHFTDFKEYFISPEQFLELKRKGLPIAITSTCDEHLRERFAAYKRLLRDVEKLAAAGRLPGVVLRPDLLKISPNESMVPVAAKAFNRSICGMLPKVKITEVLREVQQWTNFARHFRHIETGEPIAPEDLMVFLSVILSQGINLGFAKMSDACEPLKTGITYDRLNWIHDLYVSDEAFTAALADILKIQHALSIAALWGDGTTSSSDAQWFEVGGHARKGGDFNRRHGTAPGRQIHTGQTDRHAFFGPKVITTGHRDATHVLDAILGLEPDWIIKEHYTDTLGFTDHVFALFPFYDRKFSPRLRNFHELRMYVPPGTRSLPHLDWMIAGELDVELIRRNWDEILRLATSIKMGTVTASLILRKLGGYPRQTELSAALRELGRLERSIFMLEWITDPEQRRKTSLGLNKHESSNALKRAVYVFRGGDIRDRTFESQQHRACGLTLVSAAIVLWNTTYLERALDDLRARNIDLEPDFLCHLSPQMWDHINLSGDYLWYNAFTPENGYRPLRSWRPPLAAAA